MNQRKIRDKAQGVRAIVVPVNDDRERRRVLQNDCPWAKGIPLRPGHPDTTTAIGVEVVDKPNDVVPEFPQKDISGRDRGYEIRSVSLKGREGGGEGEKI